MQKKFRYRNHYTERFYKICWKNLLRGRYYPYRSDIRWVISPSPPPPLYALVDTLLLHSGTLCPHWCFTVSSSQPSRMKKYVSFNKPRLSGNNIIWVLTALLQTHHMKKRGEKKFYIDHYQFICKIDIKKGIKFNHDIIITIGFKWHRDRPWK